MATFLHRNQVLSSQTPVQKYELTLSFTYNISARTTEKHSSSNVVVQLLQYYESAA
jgi:hypothetical protein